MPILSSARRVGGQTSNRSLRLRYAKLVFLPKGHSFPAPELVQSTVEAKEAGVTDAVAMHIYMKVAYMSIHRSKLIAGGALMMLLAAGVFGLFQNLGMSMLFLALAMGAGLLAILGYLHTTNHRISRGEKVMKTEIARLAERVEAVSQLVRLQENSFLESGSQQRALIEESKAAKDSHDKSLGLLFREVRYISSILSGAEPVLSQQDEKRLTTCLLALNVAKRDLETAINRLATRVKVDA